MGKTSIVLNIAKNVAQLHDLPVCMFSLEMSKEQLTYRLLSMEVGIESGRLRTGRLNQEEWPLLGQGISTLGRLPIFIDDKPNAGVLADNGTPCFVQHHQSFFEMRSGFHDVAADPSESLRELPYRYRPKRGQRRTNATGKMDLYLEVHSGALRGLMAEQGRELGLIVIDYLQLMEGSGSDNRVQELSRITRGLKQMARELNVPVIALSQLSRGVEARTNKRPMLSDLRESGSIEQDADIVMMIYRDEYYNPETPDRGITEVIVTKHRNGPVGTVKLLFESQFTRFRNLAAPGG